MEIMYPEEKITYINFSDREFDPAFYEQEPDNLIEDDEMIW